MSIRAKPHVGVEYENLYGMFSDVHEGRSASLIEVIDESVAASAFDLSVRPGMSQEKRLEGKVMITGAASGIGLACAERFVREGAVVAGFDLTPRPAEWNEIEKAAPGSTRFRPKSGDSSFVTGHALPVDGGYVAGHRYGHTKLMGLD